jgi:peptide/nickel transport system permease protein
MSAIRETLARIWREREGRLGMLFVALIVTLAILGPWLGQDPNHIDVKARFLPPGIGHFLGTDNLGRDLFARIAAGTRSALSIAIIVVALSFFIGSIIGIAAGLAGSAGDRAITALFDVISAFPVLILAFALVALYGTGYLNFLLVVTILFIPQFGRMARARTLGLKHQSFIEAERLIGLHPAKIVLRHFLPNVAGPLIVLASMNIPVVITIEAGLSFLGLGVQPPNSSLGTLIKDGYIYLNQSWWPTVGAAVVLAIATLGATLFGEAMRRVLDPKLSGDIP